MSSMSKDEINAGLFNEVSRLKKEISPLRKEIERLHNEEITSDLKICELQTEIKQWERISDKQVEHLTRNGKQIIELKTELDLLTDIINNSKHADEIWDEYNKVKETFK